MKTIITTICFLSIFISCNKSDKMKVDNIPTKKNLISRYIEPTKVLIFSGGDPFQITASIEGQPIDSTCNDYSIYAAKYGDTCYNDIPYRSIGSISKIITSISIVSDTDFDIEHPAGTPLDNIVYAEASTPYYFINNGYKYPDNMAVDSSIYCNNIIYKLLSELDAEGLILVQPYLHLSFSKFPTLNKTHTLTLTCALESGKVLKDESKVTFP